MLRVIAPTMGDRVSGARSCVDDQIRHPSVLTVIPLALHMTACVPILVLLLVAQAAVPVWDSCARGAKAVGRRMTPAGRIVLASMCSWRRAIYVFYLGTAAGWTSSRTSLNFSLPRPAPPGEIEPAPEGLFVLGGHSQEAAPRKLAIGIGNAA